MLTDIVEVTMDTAAIAAIKANLFPSSHAAIDDWDNFPWHSHKGIIQTFKQESSQALAIDVFGSIKMSKERDTILASLARSCSLPDEGPWTLKLEWQDPNNLLREPNPTQVDAIAFGRHATLIIECKFTELGGGCSQVNEIKRGAHRGSRQCNGNYELQVNPINGIEARCALEGKGVRYWDFIPSLFGLSRASYFQPCPFKDDGYQWMRNIVLAECLTTDSHRCAVIAAYADADSLPTAKKVRSGTLGVVSEAGSCLVTPMSYQSIISNAADLADERAEWDALSVWVSRKIAAVTNQMNGLIA
jgi:hypothetical protein